MHKTTMEHQKKERQKIKRQGEKLETPYEKEEKKNLTYEGLHVFENSDYFLNNIVSSNFFVA